MNLTKLFEAQAVLDSDIELHHPVEDGEDRLSKKILALLVELGECANEWRGFKFWSNDQNARIKVKKECKVCEGTGDVNYEMIQEDAEGNGDHEYIPCDECRGTGYDGYVNPLLEEYVDCLHFILSIGNQIKCGVFPIDVKHYHKESTVDKQFLMVMDYVVDLPDDDYYKGLMHTFIHLGTMLGFTWEQIEQAYYDKNKINFERQKSGY
ncbi:dUTP diphosphatase [Viridibacillus arvi]|uniref:dUTP diphosphatase n=1 Tax=Viridibacillus arvi TaxID=263475 RepID=UPI003D047CDB